jgi:hypothetical protein
MDRFREFVRSEGFRTTYNVDEETMNALLADDVALMAFGDRMIRQIMYAEKSIPMKADALETHLARRRKKAATEAEDSGMERPGMAACDLPLEGEEGKSEDKQ